MSSATAQAFANITFIKLPDGNQAEMAAMIVPRQGISLEEVLPAGE